MPRPRKPNATKIAEGMRGHAPLRPEPQHAEGIAEKPAFENARASELWDKLIAVMDPGALRQTDAEALATLCEDQARLEESNRKLNRMKNWLTTTRGRQAMKMIHDLTNRVIVQRREFGLTPASRTRIATTTRKETGIEPVSNGIFSRRAEMFVLPKAN